jgi:hypothetical protein
MSVQSYDKSNQSKAQIHTFKIEFAHISLSLERPNILEIKFKKAFLKKKNVFVGKMSPYLKVISNGWTWTSKSVK